VVRRLFGDVVPLRAVRIVPVTSEDLAEDWVERFLDTPTCTSVAAYGYRRQRSCIRRFDVPPTEVELGHGYEPLHGVFNLRDWEQSLGMCHEATSLSVQSSHEQF
jgi:hypothetical protein